MRGLINRRRQKKIDYNKYVVTFFAIFYNARVNLLDFMMYM